ncbi:MAG: M48 family metallopeptidase [Synergistaceae bacterium]|nr:M48 family metallopeptidase [Synergistaceae bacterium]
MSQEFACPYTVRRSARARHVRFVVSSDGLAVVVPNRFCVSRDLPPLLEEKKDWIAGALEKVAARVQQKADTSGVPDVVALPSLEEQWRVTFAPLANERLTEGDGVLVLTSDFSENEAIAALNRWLRVKARARLPELLDEEARRYLFSYSGVAVKEHKSRWGSCSSKGNINLNSRLLFLPPCLTRHVLLHELCHLREMNHSKDFHCLLDSVDPDAKKHAAQLRQAWSFVPGWALR